MKTFSIVCLVLITMKLSAQIDDSTSLKQLPFDIDDSKRMDEKDLLNKTEGYFLTGLPEIENNPINGFGIGANFFVYNNGLKEDPFLHIHHTEPDILDSLSIFKVVSGKVLLILIYHIFLIQNGELGLMEYLKMTQIFSTLVLALIQ